MQPCARAAACRATLETPFGRRDLGKGYHFAADLLRARLLPTAKILPFRPSSSTH